MKISYRNARDLRPAEWATSFLLRPDERLLTESLHTNGWLVPLVVTEAGLIVDGNQRYRLVTSERRLSELTEKIPVSVVSIDEVDAMLLHVQLNRGRGMVVAKRLSNVLHEMLASGRWETHQLMRMLCMTSEEFSVLHSAVYLKMKSISQHQYSRAWVPIEAPKPGDVAAGMEYEYPLNADN